MFNFLRKTAKMQPVFVPEDGARELVNHLNALRNITPATPFDKLPQDERDKLTFIAARVASAAKP